MFAHGACFLCGVCWWPVAYIEQKRERERGDWMRAADVACVVVPPSPGCPALMAGVLEVVLPGVVGVPVGAWGCGGCTPRGTIFHDSRRLFLLCTTAPNVSGGGSCGQGHPWHVRYPTKQAGRARGAWCTTTCCCCGFACFGGGHPWDKGAAAARSSTTPPHPRLSQADHLHTHFHAPLPHFQHKAQAAASSPPL